MTRAQRRGLLVVFSAVMVLSAACGEPPASDARQARRLSVFAAASLTDVMESLAQRYEASHPEVDVVLTFAGSQVLRMQIAQGAPADIFISANEVHLQALVNDGLADAPMAFVENELTVIVPRGSPISAFDEILSARRVIIGSEHVPVGSYARQMLARRGLDFESALLDHVVSEESNVRLIRAKVAMGEADVGIVYRSDAQGAADIVTIPVPDAYNVRARYPMARVCSTSVPVQADAFLSYLASEDGQRVATEFGFISVVDSQ